MSYARLDDGFYGKPEVLETSLEGIGVHGLALAYCACHLTDGKLSFAAVTMLARGAEHARRISDELVATKMWERDGDGFVIRSYLETNLSAKDAEVLRKAAKQRMRKFRMRSHTVRANKPGTNTFVPDRTGQDSSSDSSSASEKEKTRAKQTALPADFPLNAGFAAVSTAAGCRDPERMHAAFVDYWHGEGRRKADWLATYRNWARRAHGGPPNFACGCAPTGAKVTTMDAVRSLAAKIAVREGMGR